MYSSFMNKILLLDDFLYLLIIIIHLIINLLYYIENKKYINIQLNKLLI